MMLNVTRKVWPLVLSALAVVALLLVGRRNGQLNERIKSAESRVKLQRRMRDAAANTRTDRASVSKRLQNGRF